MIWTVKDDHSIGARGIGRLQPSKRYGQVLAILLAVGATTWGPGGPLSVGAGRAFAAGMDVTVREQSDSAKRITIPLNRSVTIETSEPVTRAQVVESAIATVESITPTQFVVTGVGYGTTQLILWSSPTAQQAFEINVELDLARLDEILTKVDPQGEVTATSINGTIVLTGTVSGPEIADKMIELAQLFTPRNVQNAEMMVHNHLSVTGEHQVLLRVTVAEVARSAARELGINGFLAGDDFQDAFVVNQIGEINPANIGAAPGINAQSTIPFLTGEGGIPLASTVPLSLGFPRVQMQVFLRAMAENSLLKVLAEPNLVAISGETASFLAGGEFPIPVPQAGSASGAVTIQFREFGIRMNFTPVVLAHQKIRMRIAPEVSETDFSTALQIQGFAVPGLTQRRAETTVEVGNGQTLAVAGLLSEQVRATAQRIPGIGDVPVLGALFRSVQYRRRESELVILVTPEIVAPMDPQQVPKVPGQDMLTPSDYELYALGLLEGEADPGEEITDPDGVYRTNAATMVAPLKSEPEEMSVHGPWGYSTSDDL